MFTVPAGNALVFSDAEGDVVDSPLTVPMTRTVTAGPAGALES